MPKKSSKKAEKTNMIYWIIALVITIALAILSLMKAGYVGFMLHNLFSFVFGQFYWIVLFSFIIYAIISVFYKKKFILKVRFFVGLTLLSIAILILSAALLPDVINNFQDFALYLKEAVLHIFKNEAYGFGGGLLGYLFYILSFLAFDEVGTYVVIGVLVFIALILMIPFDAYTQMTLAYEQKKLDLENARQQKEYEREQKRLMKEEKRQMKTQKKEAPKVIEGKTPKKSSYFIDLNENELQEKPLVEPVEEVVEAPKVLKAKKKSGPYQLPPISLLEASNSKNSNINQSSANVKGAKVIEILKNFGIEAELVNTHIGPSVTKFEIKPDSSVKVNKIQNIQDNIKMELAAKDIRIEAPIPGRSAVGIEIPNVEPIPVKMLELMRHIPANKKDKLLLFALGKDLLGKGVYCELDKMPHLLIAGQTGSGKSVCINTIIVSFLMRNHPDDLKLVLIDPKKVEFTPYHDVPHLLWPVITDPTMANNMLKKIVVMMEERYDAFADVGVRNIASFNEFVQQHNANRKEDEAEMKKMPYIVVIIDELADLMMIAGKEVEASIQRITQLARACGIHLIVATQRPSTDVITGTIKSNIPSRISFAVASGIDSRTILDQVGAERLLGNGDMLYSTPSESATVRLQGVYVTDDEIKKITSHVKAQRAPVYDDTYFEFLNINNGVNNSSGGVNTDDSLYDEVVEYVKDAQKASTSLLQRRFGIGYNRAARLIDSLEERGIIGPAQGSKPREVYLKKEEE